MTAYFLAPGPRASGNAQSRDPLGALWVGRDDAVMERVVDSCSTLLVVVGDEEIAGAELI